APGPRTGRPPHLPVIRPHPLGHAPRGAAPPQGRDHARLDAPQGPRRHEADRGHGDPARPGQEDQVERRVPDEPRPFRLVLAFDRAGSAGGAGRGQGKRRPRCAAGDMAFTLAGRTTGRVAVVGSGNMGPDVALFFARRLARYGVSVVLHDVSGTALEAGRGRILEKFRRGSETGVFRAGDTEAVERSISFTQDRSLLMGCDLIVEAV